MSFFFVDEIQRILKKSEVSIICGYTYERLFDIGDDVYQYVSIIVGATDDGHIEIIDPGPKNVEKKYVRQHRIIPTAQKQTSSAQNKAKDVP